MLFKLLPTIFPLKDRGHFFQKNTPNLPFLAQEAQMNFFKLFFTFNLRGTCAKSFTNVDCTNCEIITFEVERNFFSLMPGKGNRV
jgi:hypothetical protein